MFRQRCRKQIFGSAPTSLISDKNTNQPARKRIPWPCDAKDICFVSLLLYVFSCVCTVVGLSIIPATFQTLIRKLVRKLDASDKVIIVLLKRFYVFFLFPNDFVYSPDNSSRFPLSWMKACTSRLYFPLFSFNFFFHLYFKSSLADCRSPETIHKTKCFSRETFVGNSRAKLLSFEFTTEI